MKKILIIDNNRTIVEMLAGRLSEAGYATLKAFDGMEALDILRREIPDMIILDLIMPKIDGYRLSRYLKNDPDVRNIPIIILTGVAAEDSDQMFEVDADAFIAKGKMDDTFLHLITTIKWLEARRPLKKKEILGMEGIYPREISRELLLVKQHFDSMLQVMAEGVLEMDEHHRVFFANQSACQLLEASEIELFGRNVREIFSESGDLEGYLEKLPRSQKACKPGINLSWRSRTLRFIGTPFFFSQSYIGSIAILEDITVQMKKEQALEELTSEIFKHAPIGIALLDHERRIALANQHFTALAGAQGDIRRKKFRELPSFGGPLFSEMAKEAAKNGSPTPVCREISFSPGPGDALRTYQMTASPLFRQEGKPYLLLLAEDVTEKARLQQDLVNANRELEVANQAKSNFLSIVSHELRTPLSVIRGYLSLILEGKISGAAGEALEALQISDKRARHLQKLIEELLDVSRIEAGKITLREDLITLGKHIGEVLDMFRSDLERKKLQVDLSLPADLPDIVADHEKIHQIFTNLLSNAIKFTPDGGRIGIAATAVEGGVEAAISDSGIGIPEDKLPFIFDRFYQVDSTDTRLHGGTGLGLAIVHMIVKAMGGTIRVESRMGQGSTFTVGLPRGPVEKLKAAPAVPSKRRGAVPARAKTGRTVLLCEDDEDTIKIIGYTLTSPTYDLVVCRNCLEALQQLYTRSIDLVIVDIRLPMMSGYDFCRIVRAAEATRHIPLVILSAAGQEEEIRQGYDAGADEYIIKPFSPSDLLERINKHLQGPAPA